MAYTQKNNGVKKKKGKLKTFVSNLKKQGGVLGVMGKSYKHVWKKYGPVINPSTKNPKGIGK